MDKSVLFFPENILKVQKILHKMPKNRKKQKKSVKTLAFFCVFVYNIKYRIIFPKEDFYMLVNMNEVLRPAKKIIMPLVFLTQLT